MFIILGADGKEYGPATASHVREWMRDGRANRETKARRVAETAWRPLSDFEEICPPATPPPPHFQVISDEPAEPAPDAAPVVPLVLADRWVRLGARLIDFFITLLFITPGAIQVGWELLWQLARGETPDETAMAQAAGGFLLMFAGLLLPFIVQVWLLSTRGQTLGKLFTRIRIVRIGTDENPGFVHSVLLRDWVFSLFALIPVVGNIISVVDACFIFRSDQRCLHDLFAGTRVVEKT